MPGAPTGRRSRRAHGRRRRLGERLRRNPELTDKRFIANPFRNGHRIYRTGDLARFRDDGSIECLGRVDFQVKIRGFRVELGEIESVLAAQATVEQAVVVAREETPGDKRLVAYVTPAAGATIDETALRDIARATLPDYMVPTRVVVLDTLPLTTNGKIDRKALPRPNDLLRHRDPVEPPQGETEVGLEELLKQLLGVHGVGRHENLFDIGGHSLLAARYFNEIHKLHGIRLPISILLQAGSIAQLASVIDARRRTHDEVGCLVPINAGHTAPRFFCVHGAGGNVLFYRELSNRLGVDFPFYGLQSRGLDGRAEPLYSIEDMARTYVEEMRAVQASGPYYLGGYCLGGVIAYEMAQRLQDQGETVALLALLDTYNFYRMEQIGALGSLMQRTRFHICNLLGVPLRAWPGYLQQKLQVARDGELRVITRSFLSGHAAHHESPQGRIHRLNVAAVMRYRPLPYPGVVTNFKPKTNYTAYPDPNMGWGNLALGGVKNVTLDCHPHAMLNEPFVRELADELTRALSVPNGRAARPANPNAPNASPTVEPQRSLA